MYKLICVDLDGTLLDTHLRISSKNKQAIRSALDSGIDVVIVSGRPNCFTIRIMDQISGRMGHITFNGAYYRVENKTRKFPIDPVTALKVARLAQEYNVRMYFKNKNLAICNKSDIGSLDYDNFREQTPVKDRMDIYHNVDVVNYLTNHGMEILKIVALDDDELAMAKVVEKMATDKTVNLYAYEDYFEMSSSDTSKGMAIVNMAKDLGIELQDVVGIGDAFNDMSMLEVVGLPIAMGNAPDKVKNICKKVTLSNEESGVGYAIEHFVLEANEAEKQ